MTADRYPNNFNCSNTNNLRDELSTFNGPAPKSVVLGKVAGRILAFISLNGIGGVIVYDVSNPFGPKMVDYVNTRNFTETFSFETAGDLGPAGLSFIGADESPIGKPLLAVANETSGSVTIFRVDKQSSSSAQ